MKSFKYLMMAAVAAMLFACGDDSSSDSGSNASGGGSGEATEVTGKVSINEAKGTIQYYTQRTVEGCFQKGLDFSWKTVDLKVDTTKLKYEFVDDTLVIYSSISTKDFSTTGLMYVGGKVDESLNGTWTSTLCYYNQQTAKSSCKKACSVVREKWLEKNNKKSVNDLDDDDRAELNEALDESKCLSDKSIKDVTMKISGSEIKVITQQREVENYDFDDYKNSYFISSLYSSISNGACTVPLALGIMTADSMGVQTARRLAGKVKETAIKETSKGKSSLTFEVGNDAFPITVKVSKADYDDDNGKVKIAMSVDMGAFSAKVCELQYEAGSVTKSDCSDDNSDLFNDPVGVEDDEGGKYKYVSSMEESNADDFNDCLFKGLKKLAAETHGTDSRCPTKYDPSKASYYYYGDYDYYYDDYDYDDYYSDYVIPSDGDYSDYLDYYNDYYSEYYDSMMKASGNKELPAKVYLKIRNAQIRALKELSK